MAVAFLLFFRCVLFGKVGKSYTDTTNDSSQDVPGTAEPAKAEETSKVNNNAHAYHTIQCNTSLCSDNVNSGPCLA